MSAILSMPLAGALTEIVPTSPSLADGTGLLAGGTLFTGMLAGALAIPGADLTAEAPAAAAMPAEATVGSESSAGPSLADAPLLAQILQAMGIQATPERLSSLTPLEMQQVSSALEFAATQLATGRHAPEDVMEEAEVLLPQGLEFTGLPVPAPTAAQPAAVRPVPAAPASAKHAADGQDPAPRAIGSAAQDIPEAVVSSPRPSPTTGATTPIVEDAAAGLPAAEASTPSPEAILALVETARRLLGQGGSTGTAAANSPAAPATAAAAPYVATGRTAEAASAAESVEEAIATASTTAGERAAAPARRARGRAEAAPTPLPSDSRLPEASRSADAPAAPPAPSVAAPANSEPPKGVRLLRQAFEESMQGGGDTGTRANRNSETVRDSAQPAFRPGSPASEMVARQVFDGMHVLLTEGRDEMRMSLWPENLGRVSVRLKIEDGERVDVRVLVQSDSVKQALDAAIPTLRETLARQGLELGSLSVSVGGKDHGGESGDPGAQGDPRRNASRRGAELEEAVASRAPLLRGIDTGWRNGRNSIDVLL